MQDYPIRITGLRIASGLRSECVEVKTLQEESCLIASAMCTSMMLGAGVVAGALPNRMSSRKFHLVDRICVIRPPSLSFSHHAANQ